MSFSGFNTVPTPTQLQAQGLGSGPNYVGENIQLSEKFEILVKKTKMYFLFILESFVELCGE